MKRYLLNLLIALMGKNPYQLELDRVTMEYDETAEVLSRQREQYYELLAKKSDTDRKVKELEDSIKSFQNLTENLRQSITDKEIKLEQQAEEHKTIMEQSREMYAHELAQLREQHERERVDRHEEYEERMAERDEKIVALRGDLDTTLAQLQKANRAIANDLMAQAMLDKTNNALEDLCAAMQSGEVERVLMATQYLDWHNALVRIAQTHLSVLRRKNELVERLHFTDSRTEDDNVNYE